VIRLLLACLVAGSALVACAPASDSTSEMDERQRAIGNMTPESGE
jgi:hypothetical protein